MDCAIEIATTRTSRWWIATHFASRFSFFISFTSFRYQSSGNINVTLPSSSTA